MRGIQVDNPVLRIGNVLQAVTGSARLFARADLADTADPRGTQSANLDFFSSYYRLRSLCTVPYLDAQWN